MFSFCLAILQLMDIWIIPLLAITNNATINICVQKKKKIALCFLKGPGKKKKRILLVTPTFWVERSRNQERKQKGTFLWTIS